MSFSLWAAYVKERNDTSVIEDERGFMSYKIVGKECYIEDAYVVPSQRQRGHGTVMLEKVEAIARAAGCECLTSRVIPSEPFATGSMKAQLARGFRIHTSIVNRIVMIKELS